MELNFDERKASELMASTFRTEHYEMVMHSGDMAWVLPSLVWHLEDLRMGMCYQNWYIARLASKFVKVTLAGTGGDELFAGYPWRYKSLLGSQTVENFNTVCCSYWHRLLPEDKKVKFFTADVMRECAYPSSAVLCDVFESLQLHSSLTTEESLTRALYFEAKTFLHGLFIVEDKISMSHSLETRVPFMDNDLVDYTLTIPSRYKLDVESLMNGQNHFAENGALLSSDGKFVLRDAMTGLIPEAVRIRKKQGFSPPDESWYRGETMNYIKEILLDRKTLARGYFQPAYIRKVVDEHTSGKVNHRLLIWSLLCFEWWNRIFMDNESRDLFELGIKQW